MVTNGTPIIPGEVLIFKENLPPKREREPFTVTTDLQTFVTLPMIYVGMLILDKLTTLPSGVNVGISAIGATATVIAGTEFLERRGVIKVPYP